MDFGCGAGGLVTALTSSGVDSHGCDFPSELGTGDRLRAIEEPYHLPYPTDSFDAVISAQVFEHVQDYDVAFREIERVLRSGGISVHVFPGRYTPLEQHCFVPMATIIQHSAWLRLWANLGIRNQFQRGKKAREVARLNRDFLRNQTTYFTRKDVLKRSRVVFPNARLLATEPLAASPTKRGQAIYRLARIVPGIAFAYSELRSRTLVLS